MSKKTKKYLVFAGVGIAAYLFYKGKQQDATAAAASAALQTAPTASGDYVYLGDYVQID